MSNTSYSELIVQTDYDQGFTAAVVVSLSVVAVLGGFGNVLVVAVICRAKKLRSVMNRFVLHLAISDLIVCVFGIPLFLTINFKKTPSVSSQIGILTLCKLGRFVQYLAPLASLTLLITIGLNRHQAIVHPLNIMTYGQANRLIAAAWIFALVMVAPSLYLTQLQTMLNPLSNSSYPYCATIQTDDLSGLVYTFALSLLGYVIPLIVLIVLYTKIYLTVWRRPKTATGQDIARLPTSRVARTKKKVLKMLITVILVFLITWLPLFIYVGVIQPLLRMSKPIDHVRLITYALGLSQSCVNPIIYGFFNKNFRDGCKEVFRVSFKIVRTPAVFIQRSVKRKSHKSAYSPKEEEDITNLNRQKRDKYRSTSDINKPDEKDNESLEDEESSIQHQVSLKRSGGIRLKEMFATANEQDDIANNSSALEGGSKGIEKQKLISTKSDGYRWRSENKSPNATCPTPTIAPQGNELHQMSKKWNKKPLHETRSEGSVLKNQNGSFDPRAYRLQQLQLSTQNSQSDLHKNGISSRPNAKTRNMNGITNLNTNPVQRRTRSIRFVDDYEDTRL